MSKLSKEQIKELSNKKFVLGRLKLKCDGYVITLRDGIYKRKVRTDISVDGWLKGQWLVEPDAHPESKFFMPFVRYIKMSPQSKKREKIELGMRRPDFASIGQALRHLNKVCDSVELIEENDCES
ncbi:hypothetical protein ACTXGO_00980 [Psychrobacter sp. T6-1]|uniref:hypothetical protein n=1 Tax=Psychrobacter sp. T6-1 TaxID=3457447 RepID=UPI003FD03068